MPPKRRGNWPSGRWQLGCRCWRAQTLRTTCLVKGSGSFILCTYPPTKTVLRRRMSIVGGVFRVWGASVVRVGVWRGGWWRARRRADRGECERGRGVRQHVQVSPARSRPRVPALHTTSAAPPDQDGNVRCPELDARTRRRAVSRCLSHCSTHQRRESKTHHKEGRARPRASGSAQSVCIERPCEAR